jgi:hypothetical protein
MNIVYENSAIQGCKKICHSIGGSCGEKLKKFYFLTYRLHKLWSLLDKNSFFSIMLFESCRA